MTSIRHNTSEQPPSGPDDAYLDAARASVLAVGWRRTSLTDVARRAGVSRMTLYRRWPDMSGLLGDLMLREWGALVAAELHSEPTAPLGRHAVAAAVVRCTGAVRDNDLFRKIVEVDPDLLLPYLFERRGRTQDLVLDALAAVLTASRDHPDDPVRADDAMTLASGVLLTLHGFLFSAPTMTEPVTGGTTRPDLAALDRELARLIERYLAP
ncbi:TetR/AcrR family transcriptional regulator [Nocardioides sp. HDW12B]|uniref:TetR/AcrR family transcriptional regulator n=1 Tax=Nocardioides sp. HDW12B TaxID=2714939 RepID=UPI00140E1043|nr:TetR/AcrR family transcriptional regulator [Nocardioides sp. HDW12B]QIK67812.1 TetR/AcrR family transcriptional regulator [Nocardioides sp. HDW12B]